MHSDLFLSSTIVALYGTRYFPLAERSDHAQKVA